ncbi:MAG TPA: tRNA 2-thiouridine(34) synthase MnmA, partial [Tenuifilaceae bacterium]|nr:tRNA 2-thiouridine(34) synthase MnmA [Tenuifilaceae bacterium]
VDATNLQELAKPSAYQPTDGMVVGKHNGAHFYTIGQRKGLNIGGKPEPLFVIATDIERNIVYVGQGHSHPGLNRKALFIPSNETHWVRPDLALLEHESRNLLVRIRYRQPLQKATLVSQNNGIYIVFDEMQRGITAGQFAAWYLADELIGSGVIS